MPWRGPTYEGEFPSLGWQVATWASEHFKVPDGSLAGQPLTLTNEQLSMLVRWYRLDERGRWYWRRGAVRRPQGWGKSPLLAVIGLAELAGPSRFDGWDATGEPVGVEPESPWVQIAAVSEDQADNTYAAAYAMAKESPLNGSLIDVGLTRMFRTDGPGRLEAVTSAAGTRLGQRITFAVLDETHLWTPRNGGKKLAATIRRNAGKMNGRTFESTNAHAPGEGSVAEDTWKAAEQAAGGLLYDAAESPKIDDLTDREQLLDALRVVYGDAVWVDLERIADEIADPATDPDDARRFYLNQLVSGRDRFVDMIQWDELADPERVVEPGERVGLGFDGSISDDATALYGCTADGFVFEVAVWERPLGAREWKVPRVEVEEAVAEAMERYDVGRMLCDPPLWRTEIEYWAERWNAGKTTEEAVVVELQTNSTSRYAPICDRFATAVREGSLSHDGKEGLRLHLAACARKRVRAGDDPDDMRSRFVVVKADTRKIDRAVGATLAFEAAMTMPEVAPAATWFGGWA